MFVCTLRAPNEVRATSAYFDDIPEGEPDAEMLQLAEALIAQKTTKFDPKAYEDRYETALMAMIKEKLKGHKPIIAAAPERGNVVNLMDALKASLGQAKPPAPSRSKAPAEKPAEKPAAKAAGGGRRARGQGQGVSGAGRRRPSASSARSRPSRGGWRRARSSARAASSAAASARRTTHVVFGRTLLGKSDDAAIEARVDGRARRRPAGC